jgi:hypothetical protein
MTDIESTILERLAAIESSITGVVKAKARLPRTITAADMPLFLNYIGPAQYDYQSSDLVFVTRTFRPTLYIMSTGQGIENEAQEKAEPFFTRVRDEFGGRPSLNSLKHIQDCTLVSDTSVVVLAYLGNEYLGIEWSLRIEYIAQRTIQGGN